MTHILSTNASSFRLVVNFENGRIKSLFKFGPFCSLSVLKFHARAISSLFLVTPSFRSSSEGRSSNARNLLGEFGFPQTGVPLVLHDGTIKRSNGGSKDQHKFSSLQFNVTIIDSLCMYKSNFICGLNDELTYPSFLCPLLAPANGRLRFH